MTQKILFRGTAGSLIALAIGISGQTALAQPPAPPVAPPSLVQKAEFALITGTVTYRERIALPADAELVVSLEDVSRPVGSRSVAAVTTFTNGKQVPLSFAIPYRKADIVPGHRYLVRALIKLNDKMGYDAKTLGYASTADYPVLTKGAPTTVSLLLQSAEKIIAGSSSATLEETYWKLTYLDGQPSLAADFRQEPQITLHKEGKKLSGTGGCNRMFGTYTLSGDALKFSGIGATMMACPPPLMQQERKFSDALKATTSYRINGEELELRSGKRVLARFQSVYLR